MQVQWAQWPKVPGRRQARARRSPNPRQVHSSALGAIAVTRPGVKPSLSCEHLPRPAGH